MRLHDFRLPWLEAYLSLVLAPRTVLREQAWPVLPVERADDELSPLMGRWFRSGPDPRQDAKDPIVVRDVLRIVVDPQNEDAATSSSNVTVAELPTEQFRIGRLVER